MIYEELTQYIRQQLALKTSREEITDVLLSSGWNKEDIQDSLNEVDKIHSASNVPFYSSPPTKGAQNSQPQNQIQNTVLTINNIAKM